MKASELRDALAGLMQKHGDLAVVFERARDADGSFEIQNVDGAVVSRRDDIPRPVGAQAGQRVILLR